MSKHALPSYAQAPFVNALDIGGTDGDLLAKRRLASTVPGQLWQRLEETAEARYAALPARDLADLRHRAAGWHDQQLRQTPDYRESWAGHLDRLRSRLQSFADKFDGLLRPAQVEPPTGPSTN